MPSRVRSEKSAAPPRPYAGHERSSRRLSVTFIIQSSELRSIGWPGRVRSTGRVTRRASFGKSAAAVIAVAFERVLNNGVGESGRREVIHFDRLAFEHLVILKEPAQHAQPMLWQLARLLEAVEFRIVHSHGKDLVVALARIDHGHEANGASLDQSQRDDGLLAQDEHIQQVVVL